MHKYNQMSKTLKLTLIYCNSFPQIPRMSQFPQVPWQFDPAAHDTIFMFLLKADINQRTKGSMLLLIAVLTYQRAERLVGLELYVGREIWMAGKLIWQWLEVISANKIGNSGNKTNSNSTHHTFVKCPCLPPKTISIIVVSVYILFIVKCGISCFSFLNI